MTTFKLPIDRSNFAEDECGLNVKQRKSLPLNDISSNEGYQNSTEGYTSISSECISARSSCRPMSITGASAGGESMVQCMIPTTIPCAYQMPMRQVQSVEGQIQHSNVNPAQMRIPVGYSQVQAQAMLQNIQYSQPLQPQHIVYSTRQSQARVQEWAHMPNSTATVPYMMPSYAVQNISELHEVRSVASSVMSTPIFTCFSSPGYANAYGYISTPVLSSAPCTPIPYQMSYNDVPPTLQLHKKSLQAGRITRGMSCNINMGPGKQCSSQKERYTSALKTSSKLNTEQPKIAKIRSVSGRVEMRGSWEEEEDLWPGNVDYVECFHKGSSNLFVTWSGSAEKLIEKMRTYKLQVRDVLSTCDDNICNVIFESHPIARKAFTMQKQIGLRSVPPKNSRRLWLRNPSPRFLVKFETKCQLVVRKGKKECHDIVGELLKGCLFSADQLKGHRIRVASCEGNFKFPGGRIVEMKGISNNSEEKASLGWISYRSKYTKEPLVIRRSWHKLVDYVKKS